MNMLNSMYCFNIRFAASFYILLKVSILFYLINNLKNDIQCTVFFFFVILTQLNY